MDYAQGDVRHSTAFEALSGKTPSAVGTDAANPKKILYM
jgi:hypothetical protein